MLKLNLSPRNCFQNFRVSTTTKKPAFNHIQIKLWCCFASEWFVHTFGISATFCNSINIKAIARAGGAIVGRIPFRWEDNISININIQAIFIAGGAIVGDIPFMGKLPPHQYQR